MKVRVRFAPSPTGYLHVGGGRTALYNWLYAKHFNGDFILRIEDTDQARSTKEFEAAQIADFKWLGLNWQEGPDVGGPHGPYRQSERLSIYAEHAKMLLDAGKAYYCFCTDAELEEKKQIALKQGRAPHYDGKCRHLPQTDVKLKLESGAAGSIRFWIKNPKHYTLEDLIRHRVEFPENMVGDFVIIRTGGMPVYNFCCVIDDHLMKITHVLRAEEHLSNTVRQMMLYEAFGWEIPKFGHMSVMLGPDKQKLSKRHGATSVTDFKNRGYVPEALNNFVALCGWSSPDNKEVMTIDEMIKNFGTERMNPAPAVFDEKKLKWMNSVYLRAMDHKELWKRLDPFLKADGQDYSSHTEEWKSLTLGAFKSSFETLVEAVEIYRNLSMKFFAVADDAKEILKWEKTKLVVNTWLDLLNRIKSEYLSEADFQAAQTQVQTLAQVKGKELFQPMRVAVIGKPHGTELKLLVPLLSRKELIERAEKIKKEISNVS